MKRTTAVTAAIFVLSAGIAFGQATNSADVRGTVTDTTGAIVPGVTVKVTDIDKGVVRTYVTNDAGLYDTGPIVPEDHYTVEFSRDGFSTLLRGPMTLRVGITGLDVRMGIAHTTQQVIVSDSGAPLLETTTAEISSTLPSETMQNLPQVGSPDWQQFIVLLPGTRGVAQSYNNVTNPGMGGVSANGSMPFSSALLDGAVSNSPQADNVIVMPVFDAIAEVKISDSLFSAQYPTGGILYNQITKGGTNQIHGMAYDYIRNNALNAATYAFGTGRIPIIHFNDFGFNLGGPAIKNRVFLFFDWDHTISNGQGAPGFITVPTDAMRKGDFTGMATLYDPTTQTVDPATDIVTRQSFASEYGNGNKIPAGMIDTVAKNIQALYPAANLPGTVSNGVTTNNYTYVLPSITRVQKYFGRIDADVTPNNRITGSASHNENNSPALSPVCPVNCDHTFLTGNINSQLSDVWTINPTTINEARAGFYGEYDNEVPDNLGQGWPTKLGLQFAKTDAFPTIGISGWYGFGPGTNFVDKENLFDLSDTVTLIRGAHVLHTGVQGIIERVDATIWGGINAANLSFNGAYTTGSNDKASPLATTTGSPYADFLMGYAQSWSAGVRPEYGGRQKGMAAFIQDDWKFTPKLTLNLGLRWEARTGWSEVQNNIRSFDPTIINPANNKPGAMWYASTHVNGRTALEKSQYDTWLPRIGLAYQLSSKMTVRTGFGMYSFPWSAVYSNGVGSAFGTSGNETDSTNNVFPVVLLSSDGNTNYQGSKGASINARFLGAPTGPNSYNGQGVSFAQYDQPLPILKQWNLDVARQVTSNTVVEVAYVGSRGTNLAFVTDLNQVPESLLGPNDASSRPYPVFQSITGIRPQGVSNYNALEGTVARRMSNGLEFNFNYTWSHMLSNQDSSGWNSLQGTQAYQRAYDPSANYGASNFDIRNMFKGQTIYQLPFGHGRPFLSQGKILDEVVGGWIISGTWMSQGGNPFTPHMLVNNSYAQSSNMSWYPNQVGNPKLSHRGINGWFNTAAYQSPAPGTFGNMRRNSVYGPGMQDMNMSLHKVFPIFERVSFDFSANATNVLNHPSFGQPDSVIGPGHSALIRSTTVGGRSMELIGKIRF